MNTIKTTQDGFVWLVVTEKAKEVYASGLFELYVLYEDESEALAESLDQINQALENGLNIGIQVGFVNTNVDLFEYYNRVPKNIKYIIERYTDSDVMTYYDCKAMLCDLEANGYTFDYGLDCQPFNLRPNGK